jgi:glycosyltransferase involved in cell wall biosynthesis
MTTAMSRVLWVSFDFPPRQSSAVYRPIKIYKYLDKNAFEVDFLTQSLSFKFKQAILDETLLKDVSPIPRVHKVANWVPHDLIVEATRRRKRRPKGRTPSNERAVRAVNEPSVDNNGNRRMGLATRTYGKLAMLAYFPDQFLLWGWLSAAKALSLHLRRGYDVVYTTSYPESCHLAGLALKAFGVKWVADYRYGGPLWIRKLLGYRKSSWRDRRDARFQKRVLETADVVVTQSDSIKEDFCRVFGLEREKLTTIPSGYDESDFLDSPAEMPFEKRDGEIHMIHAGAAYLGNEERTRMVEEMNALAAGLAEEGHRLVVHALGDNLFEAASARDEIRFGYHFHGVVPHPKLPDYLNAADWYLLSTLTSAAESGAINGYLPSKMWEYMRGGKPVVLFGPKDEVWRILDEAGVGVYMGALDNRDRPRADHLLAAIQSLAPVPSRIGQHSWESRAQAMQRVFTKLVGAARGLEA